MKVLVLGASGMLGSMVFDGLRREPGLDLSASVRREMPAAAGVRWRRFDACAATPGAVVELLEGMDWVVNCIGIIKQRLDEDCPGEVEQAIRVNALFPHLLAAGAAQAGCRVLQIATDCVFTGRKGAYLETDRHDAEDVYGKSKSLGEVHAAGFHNLRCSIVGPEVGSARSLLGWFLGQAPGARLRGFANHYWNGITTLHFARICAGLIRTGADLPSLVHVVPADTVSKGGLLQCFAEAFDRLDLQIEVGPVPEPVDRSLATLDAGMNQAIWRAAGYGAAPTVEAMVQEMAQYVKNAGGNQS